MMTHNAFIFDKDFSHISVKNQIFSEEDIEIAKKEGIVEGFEEGQRQAFSDIQSQTLRVLEKMNGAFQLLFNKEEYEKLMLNQISALSSQSIKALLPHYINDGALIEIESLVKEIMRAISKPTHLKIMCHPLLKEALNEKLSHYANSLDFAVTIKADESFDMTDAKVEWDAGIAWRCEKEILEEIQKHLEMFMEKKQ